MKKQPKSTFSKTTPTIDKSTQLNSSAVDRLVEAANGDDSGVDQEEVNKVSKKHFKFPIWFKALFLKWWFVGATCFFFYWGLGTYMSDEWLKVFVLAFATGGVTDLLTNNFFRLLETSDHEYDKYMLFDQRKKLWTLFANIAYAVIITLLVVIFYDKVNALIIKLNPTKYDVDSVPWGVEPLSYGLVYLVFDMAVISIKNLIVKLIRKNKENK